MTLKNQITFPTILTLIRLLLSPILLPFLFVYLLPLNIFWINLSLALLFALFSITDFFDGYFARRYAQVSTIGRTLDPIADKFLLYSVLIALLTVGKIFFLWVLIFIGREFFILGLRQVALEHSFSVHVSWFGKVKTFFQSIYLLILIANPYHSMQRSLSIGLIKDFQIAPVWTAVETSTMLIAIGLSIISAERYYRSCIIEYQNRIREHTSSSLY